MRQSHDMKGVTQQHGNEMRPMAFVSSNGDKEREQKQTRKKGKSNRLEADIKQKQVNAATLKDALV